MTENSAQLEEMVQKYIQATVVQLQDLINETTLKCLKLIYIEGKSEAEALELCKSELEEILLKEAPDHPAPLPRSKHD